MNTFSGIELRHIPTHIPRLREEWEALLAKHQLTPTAAKTVVGLYDVEDTLVGCASLDRGVIQCVAVEDALQGEGLTNTLISYLREKAREEGVENLMIFTKPQYRNSFESLAFKCIAVSPRAVLLESDPRGVKSYANYLMSLRGDTPQCRDSVDGTLPVGAIVMNANPFTLGHRYLVEQAAVRVSRLFVILVADDNRTLFPYSLRKRMVEAGVADLENVVVCEGSRYAVSASTFPSYFIKERDALTDTHITLDLDIFAKHIAPALGVGVRFVGSEPTDPLTARYNELMREQLPGRGVAVVEIPRKESDGVISASRVRRLLGGNRVAEALSFVPRRNWHFILAWMACRALRMELDCTPKPGLVDRRDSGSHKDMDHALMSKSIDALYPYFAELAEVGISQHNPNHDDIVAIGVEGERAMLAATGGVNTYKGALFSMGLMMVAAGNILAHGKTMDDESFMTAVAEYAAAFKPQTSTHGATVRARYGLKSALDEAKTGYHGMFTRWLPYYRALKGERSPFMLQHLLLKIMTLLEDTNVYFRCGAEVAARVRGEAEAALAAPVTEESLRLMNQSFISRNISPGGAADMLGMTILADSLLVDSLKNCVSYENLTSQTDP